MYIPKQQSYYYIKNSQILKQCTRIFITAGKTPCYHSSFFFFSLTPNPTGQLTPVPPNPQ